MPELTWPLVLLALGFAVVNGANDGSALVGVGLRVRGLPPLVAIGVLLTALVVVPLVWGTGVAATLAQRLVAFSDDTASLGLGAAVVAAVAVTGACAHRGLPTSLTLALIGGIAGAGGALGERVSPMVLLGVLVAGVLAPLLGGACARGVMRLLRWSTPRTPLARRVSRAHRAGFGALAVAYAAGDGQKMIAVAAVAVGAGGTTLAWWQLAALAAAFGLGLLLGLERVGLTLAEEVTPARPTGSVTAEWSAAVAVLGSAALAAPVSIIQSLVGGLVGAGSVSTLRRVRWRAAVRLVVAWVVTLPAAAALAALLAGAAQEVMR